MSALLRVERIIVPCRSDSHTATISMTITLEKESCNDLALYPTPPFSMRDQVVITFEQIRYAVETTPSNEARNTQMDARRQNIEHVNRCQQISDVN